MVIKQLKAKRNKEKKKRKKITPLLYVLLTLSDCYYRAKCVFQTFNIITFVYHEPTIIKQMRVELTLCTDSVSEKIEIVKRSKLYFIFHIESISY